MIRPSVAYVRLFSDETGASHLETATIALQSERFAPPAPPLDVSGLSQAAGWSLLRFQPDWVGDWHSTPSRPWMFVMVGQATVSTSDGS